MINTTIENNIKQLKDESISIKKFIIDIYDIDSKYDDSNTKDVDYTIKFVIVLGDHVFPLSIDINTSIDTIYKELVKITTDKIGEKCISFYNESFTIFNKVINSYIDLKREYGKHQADEYIDLTNSELLSFCYIYNKLDDKNATPEYTKLYNLMKNKIYLKDIKRIIDADLYDFEVAEYIPKHSDYRAGTITVSIEQDKTRLDVIYDHISPILTTYIPVNYDDRDRYLFEYLDETLDSYLFHFHK